MSYLLSNHDWSHPVPIAYGPGRLAEIGKRCVALDMKNPLIVTDKDSRELPFILRTQSSLERQGVGSQVFSDISPNPRDHEIRSAKGIYLSLIHI